MDSKRKEGQLRRWLVSSAAALLLLSLYSLIFRFSAQDAEQSGSLSQYVSEQFVGIINALSVPGTRRR